MTPDDKRRLYVVSVEAETIVLATSPEEARKFAAKDAEFTFYPEDFIAREMTHMPADWDEGALPYGLRDEADPDRTVGQWIEAGAAPTYKTLRENALRQQRKKRPEGESG
jgi:hypothetical protein